MTEAEEKEKAEKLAAAKKRFEQLKKQKGKKGAAKKKDEKADAEASTTPPALDDSAAGEEAAAENDDTEENSSAAANDATTSERPAHGRQPSISVQSKIRSESFRKSSSGQTPTSPTLKSPSVDPAEGAQEVYKKQALRIEELERENKRLDTESQEATGRWRKLEEELQELRESSGDTVELQKKAQQAEARAQELEKLQSEIASLQRQNTQLQSAAASKRRQSTAVLPSTASTDDLNAQLASRAETISSLEVEMSNLHSKLSAAQSANDTLTTRITTLESELERAEDLAESTTKELADLKANLDKASERAVAEGSERSSAETRIAQVEAELGSAKRSAEQASKRAEILEKKVETLTTLHRESDARNQSKLTESQKVERDAKELRARVTALSNENSRLRDESIRRKKLEVDGDSAGLEELEDEERHLLQVKVRELEEEVFELRRGAWRDKRRELQPGLNDTSGFDDVDLSAASPTARKAPAHSTFTDVLQSGISAFTGAPPGRRQSTVRAGGARKQSLGLLDDDDEDFTFDEDAFRKAQEDESKARLERVKEVKRGLKDWEGWKVDMVDLRSGLGGVFEV